MICDRPAVPWRAAGRSLFLLFVVAFAGCSRAPEPARAPLPPDTFANPRIIVVHPKLQCVTYARRKSGIDLQGNAGDWWREAEGRYARGATPQPGAVLVFKPYRQSPGHLAVVKSTANPRVIVVDHADWLNDGYVHKSTPVLDVSEQGDWSQVRVWYSPGASWGLRVYAIHGFIYPVPRVASAGANWPSSSL